MNDIQFRWMGKTLEFRVQRMERITTGGYDNGAMGGYNQLSWSKWQKVPRFPVRRPSTTGSSRSAPNDKDLS